MTKQLEQLVKMANQIALNLGAGHDTAAAERTADHIRRFWTPAMTLKLTDHWCGGGTVEPAVAAALAALGSCDHKER